MDVETIFEASYERLIGSGVGITERGRRFFHRFYENFLSDSDAVREKFEGTDMDRQEVVLQKGMYHLISFYLIKQDNEFLQEIAKTHSRSQYDIGGEYYDLWLDALLKTVEELDPEFDDDLRLAWQIVMTPGILYMKHHYA
jgi:hemoglobin-like flavoprotein